MRVFSSSQAQANLSELISHAIAGQDVAISRDGIAVAKIIPLEPPKEKLDFEAMRAPTSKMKLYPGSFVEDMRAKGEL